VAHEATVTLGDILSCRVPVAGSMLVRRLQP
jgi:hypothetical protein